MWSVSHLIKAKHLQGFAGCLDEPFEHLCKGMLIGILQHGETSLSVELLSHKDLMNLADAQQRVEGKGIECFNSRPSHQAGIHNVHRAFDGEIDKQMFSRSSQQAGC